MNLNLLISKYVDGDLTVEEDQHLRRLLSEQPAAKEAFDAATVLHFTMLEDADSITIPTDFLLETEARITMKFAAQEALNKAKLREERLKYFKNSVGKLSSVIAAMLLICTVPFSDMFRGGKSLFVSNESSQFVNSQNDVSVYSDEQSLKLKHRVYSNSPVRRALAAQSSVEGSFAANDENLTTSVEQSALNETSNSSSNTQNLNKGNKTTNLNSFTSPNSSNGTFAPKMNGVTLPTFALGLHPSAVQTQDLTETPIDKTEIQVSTFVANNVANSHDNSISVKSVSQSIAYSLGENSSIGVEIGYKGYTYQSGGTVLVPSETGASLSNSKTLGMDGPEKIGTPSDVYSPTVERASLSKISNARWDVKNVEYTADKTMYWGAAFYEYMVFHQGNVSVNARLGAGGSNDGAMTFSRAFARYDVVKGVALTLGAEASAFMVTMPDPQNRRGELNSSISLVYGMQVKF